MARAIIMLPGTALVFVPAAILWASAGSASAAVPTSYRDWEFWLALLLLLPGLALGAWTMRLFLTLGEGTPAPGTRRGSWWCGGPTGTSATP